MSYSYNQRKKAIKEFKKNGFALINGKKRTFNAITNVVNGKEIFVKWKLNREVDAANPS